MNNFKKVAFLVFVPAVAANEFVRDMILAPNVGPLPQTQQLKLLKTLMPQTFSKISKILKNPKTAGGSSQSSRSVPK